MRHGLCVGLNFQLNGNSEYDSQIGNVAIVLHCIVLKMGLFLVHWAIVGHTYNLSATTCFRWQVWFCELVLLGYLVATVLSLCYSLLLWKFTHKWDKWKQSTSDHWWYKCISSFRIRHTDQDHYWWVWMCDIPYALPTGMTFEFEFNHELSYQANRGVGKWFPTQGRAL